MELIGCEIRRTAVKYYIWLVGFCITASLFFVVGHYLRSSLPLDSLVICWAENLAVLIGILATACACIVFSMAVFGVSQRVKVDEGGIWCRASRHYWQEAKEIEHLGDHLRVIWKDNSYTRVFYWRPLARGSSMCSSGWQFWRALSNLRFWQPLLELLASHVALPRAKLMLTDLADAKVLMFHGRWSTRICGLDINWLFVLLIACVGFLRGASTDNHVIEASALLLVCVCVICPSYRFVWVDQEGFGIFRPVLGFKYIKFNKVVQLETKSTHPLVLLRLASNPKKDVVLRLWGICNYLTLQCLLMLKWRGVKGRGIDVAS